MLAILVCTIAAAVEHFVPPDAGLQINRASAGLRGAAIRTGSAGYPRVAVDSDAFTVRVARPARRIVSQYWSIDEYVYSVAPPDRVVAVSESAYLPNISNVYREVQKFRPAIATDPERVLRLDPDLLLVSSTSRADFCALVRSTDAPIYRVFTTFTTLAQVAETIRLTGYLTGEDEAAAKEVNRFWSEIERAKGRRKPGARPPRILGFSGHSSYGTETLFDDVVRTLGGINVGAEGGSEGIRRHQQRTDCPLESGVDCRGSGPGQDRAGAGVVDGRPGDCDRRRRRATVTFSYSNSTSSCPPRRSPRCW